MAANSAPYCEGERVDSVSIDADEGDLWAQFADEYLEGDDAEDILGEQEELLEMHRNPLNLNAATRADLLKMPFLTRAQADSIYNKVRKMHGMLSMGELAFVSNLGRRERTYMMLFFYCGTYAAEPRSFSNASAHKHKKGNKGDTGAGGAWRDAPPSGISTDLSLTVGGPVEKREGFRSHKKSELAANPNLQYLGNRLKVALRYRGEWANTLRWGITSAKSEGEPMLEGKNPFLDSYSLFLTGRRSARGVKRWVVGDYKMQMALGLVVGASSPDANSLSLSYRPRQEGLTPHSSTSEALFLRGGAIEIGMGRWTGRAFISYRDLDATIKNDSVTTIITNGYHRTHSEMSKRHNLAAMQGGAQVGYDFGKLRLSLQSAYTHYSKAYIRPTALYRRHYYRGSTFFNYSLAYSGRVGPLSAQGELAMDKAGAFSVQDRWQYAPSHRLKLNLVHRYYSARYLSPQGQSFRSASLLQNEHGILLGAAWRPQDEWLLRLWADFSHHAAPLYRCSHPSNRLSAYAQLTYNPYRHTEYYLRYKLKVRGQDDSVKHLGRRVQHSMKAQARYLTGPITMTSAADLTFLSEPNQSWHKGWMLSQRAAMVIPLSSARKVSHSADTPSSIAGTPSSPASASSPTTATPTSSSTDAPTSSSSLFMKENKRRTTVQINAAAALFRTDAYAEALRLYEPGLLYAFSMPSCYYHGLRLALSSVLALGPFSLGAKYSITHYTNRSTIGTGLRLYRGSTLQDLTVQLRLKL